VSINITTPELVGDGELVISHKEMIADTTRYPPTMVCPGILGEEYGEICLPSERFVSKEGDNIS
jgi:hypothetical protein